MKTITGTTSIGEEELTGSVTINSSELTGSNSINDKLLEDDLTTDFEVTVGLGGFDAQGFSTGFNI